MRLQTADEIREQADEILARREFQRPEPGLYERAQEEIGEAIDGVLERLFGTRGGVLFGVVLLGAAIVVVVWLAFRFGRTVQADRSVGATVMIETTRSPTEWLDEAARHEAVGAWKVGLRCRYRALVAELVRREVVAEVAGRTTGEYRVDVTTALPGAAPSFGEATELFEQAWYGDRPTGAAESGRFRTLAERTLAPPVGAGVA